MTKTNSDGERERGEKKIKRHVQPWDIDKNNHTHTYVHTYTYNIQRERES